MSSAQVNHSIANILWLFNYIFSLSTLCNSLILHTKSNTSQGAGIPTGSVCNINCFIFFFFTPIISFELDQLVLETPTIYMYIFPFIKLYA